MFSSSDERLTEAVNKKHGFDTAIDILLYNSETNVVSMDGYITHYLHVLCDYALMYMTL